MGKGWSILFGIVLLACGAMFVVAPFVPGWWLPEGVSTHSDQVDGLFYIILYITGFFFILTEALLVIFMYRYAGQPGIAPRAVSRSRFTGMYEFLQKWFPTAHRVEVAWTIVPAAILLFIAFVQVPTWLEIKDRSRKPAIGGAKVPIQVQMSARQFEWRVRYPSSQRLLSWLAPKNEQAVEDFRSFGVYDGARPKYPHLDDVHVVNELHLWKGQTILIHLNTLDVIHSFNVPHMRVKQDALPGKTIPVWFTPIKANTKRLEPEGPWEDNINPKTGKRDKSKQFRWEIACAELCGWGHHRMIGRVYVHETQDEFFDWLRKTEQEQSPPRQEKAVAAR